MNKLKYLVSNAKGFGDVRFLRFGRLTIAVISFSVDSSLVTMEDFASMGVSICNPIDEFSKNEGRYYALRRALRGLKGRHSEFRTSQPLSLLNKKLGYLNESFPKSSMFYGRNISSLDSIIEKIGDNHKKEIKNIVA